MKLPFVHLLRLVALHIFNGTLKFIFLLIIIPENDKICLTTIWTSKIDLSLLAGPYIFHIKNKRHKRRWMYEVFEGDTRKCLKVALTSFLVNGILELILWPLVVYFMHDIISFSTRDVNKQVVQKSYYRV